mgnify:CR=1 FL=1|tara:strand:- start:1977 stop:2345 length:369 start_codon:yes stop_codon:yes gene_type:complete
MTMLPPLITQGEVEQQILTLSNGLEEATELYGQLAEDAAEREYEYKHRHASRIVRLADDGRKMTALTRAAMADLEASAEFRLHLLAKARKETTKEAMLSLRHRIDAMRTLAANVRYQTETRR